MGGWWWERSIASKGIERNDLANIHFRRVIAIRAYVRAAKWIVVNLSATPRMEGKERERGERNNQLPIDTSGRLSLSSFSPLLSHPRSNRAKREGFAVVDSYERVVGSDSPADVRHKGFLDDWTKCLYHHSLALFLYQNLSRQLFTSCLVSISRNVGELENWNRKHRNANIIFLRSLTISNNCHQPIQPHDS